MNTIKSQAYKIINWYRKYGRKFPWRRKIHDPYKILVTEILLQKTKAETVAKIWKTFFKKFPTIRRLAVSNYNEILDIIAPLGLARRALRLKRIANQIIYFYNGKVPSSFYELLKLPGVGPYIASAVMCFGFDKPYPIVDVNVMRLINRFRGYTDEITIRSFLKSIMPQKNFKEFNWGVLDLASLVCRIDKPSCHICPLNIECLKHDYDPTKWKILRKYIRNHKVRLCLQPYSRKRRK